MTASTHGQPQAAAKPASLRHPRLPRNRSMAPRTAPAQLQQGGSRRVRCGAPNPCYAPVLLPLAAAWRPLEVG